VELLPEMSVSEHHMGQRGPTVRALHLWESGRTKYLCVQSGITSRENKRKILK